MLIVNTLIFISLVIMLLMEIVLIRKLNQVKSKNMILTEQCDCMREIKHNFFNFIQSLYGYVAIKDLHGIEKMCKEVTKETVESCTEDIICLKKIEQPALINLITQKYELAKTENIRIKIEAKTNLRKLNISTYDLCSMIGILIDNAIEAAKKSEGKNVSIKIIENKSSRRKTIIIENTYDRDGVDEKRLFDKGYTSKKTDKENHGIGLWSVKRIVDANEGVELKTRAGNTFVQRVIFKY